MDIHLLTYASGLHHPDAVRRAHEPMLAELETHFNVHLTDYRQIDRLRPDDFYLLFLATGGVENLVVHQFERLSPPVFLLADGAQNSLAAALETATWLRNQGIKCEILHGQPSELSHRIRQLHLEFQAQRALSNTRIGVIGAPSSWLVASGVDYLLAKRRWGVEYVDIPLERVMSCYEQITDAQAADQAAQMCQQALACREPSTEDMLKAVRLYRAIRQVALDERLDALTLSCFKLIEPTGTTGCLALSLLNNEGIIAGCEGDLQSIFTMLAVKALTGKSSFMANPSVIHPSTREITFAHCTIGTAQTEKFILRNHFESGTGVGIQGIVPLGNVTILKCGGECLDEYYVSGGQLVENSNELNLCRTQLRVRLDTTTHYFLKNPLGNHHIVVQGEHESLFEEFFDTNGCRRVVV
ncbi:MAG: fucose isomerase [Prevotellaceae bacterium]|jgi:L-fucose isomerase-like protein|nr:fucose isomerase [Prevotellaceae bacterium]